MLMDALTRRFEAVLALSPRPVSAAELCAACSCSEEVACTSLGELAHEYGQGRHGLELREVAGGYQLVVAADCEAAVVAWGGARAPDELSPALLETLSVVAYIQPTTRAEVARVRGVSSEWALAALEERGLIEERGRAESPGSPILYGTTDRFLTLFGLRDVAELEPLEGYRPGETEVEELRARLLANAERRLT